jgi:hypothetical protein
LTPEEFTKRNPNWKNDASRMCAAVLLGMIRDPGSPIPLPWNDDQIRMIEELATQATLDVFTEYRHQMGDEVFGELVLLVGQEAKRLALVTRDGPDETLQ